MSDHDRSGPAIGVLVPFTNTNLEPDLVLMRPPGARVYSQRMGGYDADEIPGSDQMAGLGLSDIDHDLKMIAGARPDVVLYGCTSATLTHGPDFDTGLAARVRARSGVPCLTAAGSLVGALRAMGIDRVGFSSPYLGEINRQAVDFLARCGIDTVRSVDIGRELGNYGQGALTPDEVCDLGRRADHPEAQAIVLSCTDMRAVEAIDRIEQTIGKAVVTSNQAMMFCLLATLGLPRHDGLPGRLFDHL